MKEIEKKARKWWNDELTTSERKDYLKRVEREPGSVSVNFIIESYNNKHKNVEMKKECNCKAASKSPKPILVVSLPYTASIVDYQDVRENLHKRGVGDDYHVMVIISKKEETIIEVFYEKDFNEVKFEELKEIVENSLKK